MTDFDRQASEYGILSDGLSDYAGARRSVQEALDRGWSLADVEREIDGPALRLGTDQRDALWLYAEAQADLHPRARRPLALLGRPAGRLHLA